MIDAGTERAGACLAGPERIDDNSGVGDEGVRELAGRTFRHETIACEEACMPLDRRWLALLEFGVLLILADRIGRRR